MPHAGNKCYFGTVEEAVNGSARDWYCPNCGWDPENTAGIGIDDVYVYASVGHKCSDSGEQEGWICIQCQQCYSFFRLDVST